MCALLLAGALKSKRDGERRCREEMRGQGGLLGSRRKAGKLYLLVGVVLV